MVIFKVVVPVITQGQAETISAQIQDKLGWATYIEQDGE
jgi:hypothetical protein